MKQSQISTGKSVKNPQFSPVGQVGFVGSVGEKLQSCTCIVERNHRTVYCSLKSGIAPLIDLCESGANLQDCVAYDKIVGKAAALLYVRLQVSELHAQVLSQSGLEVLQRFGVEGTYEILTDEIVNRKGDGVCPMEQAVKDINTPDEAFEVLCDKVRALA